MKLLFKIRCVVVTIAICAILFNLYYLCITYIDEAITSGEGYGFIIGDTKEKKIAPLIFLPFVENSFKHGLKGGSIDTFVKIKIL